MLESDLIAICGFSMLAVVLGSFLNKIFSIWGSKRYILILLVFAFVGISYNTLGERQSLKDTAVVIALQNVIEESIQHPGFKQEDLIDSLKKAENQIGTNAYGWSRLAEFYYQMGLKTEAKVALKKAIALNPKQLDYAFELVNLEYLDNQHDLTDELKQKLNAILEKAPKHPGALNLLAVNHFQNEEYNEAIKLWNLLISDAPEDSSIKKSLQVAIENAEQKLRGG